MNIVFKFARANTIYCQSIPYNLEKIQSVFRYLQAQNEILNTKQHLCTFAISISNLDQTVQASRHHNICTAADTKSTYSCFILVCAFLFSNELSQCLYKIMSKLTISLKVYAHEHCRNIKLPVVSGSSWKDKNGLCHEKLYFLVHQSNISYF